MLYLFWKKKESRFWALLPVIANLAGFAFNVLAPGNSIRENTAEGMGVVMSVAMSFYWGAVYVTEWLTPVVLIGFTLMLPLIWKLAKRSEISFFKPLWAAGLSFCVFSAMFTPVSYTHLNALVSDKSERYTYYFDIFKYHSNWKTMVMPSQLACWRYEKADPMKGLQIKEGVGPAEWMDYSGITEEKEPEQEQIEVLRDLLDYIGESGKEALFIVSPYVMESVETRMQFNYLERVITEAVSYTHLDVYKRQGQRHWPLFRVH